MKKYKILITTGIYPPDIGGPAKYSQILALELEKAGHTVFISVFSSLLKIPTGIRHIVYFFKVLFLVFKSDFVIALDTFSVALPVAIASKICGKKMIIRTGGDFLWESYVERTKETVHLPDFYKTKRNFTQKEKIIFFITKTVLGFASSVVFSTEYQRNIFLEAYGIDKEKTFIIENLYEDRGRRNIVPKDKIIFAGSRNIFLKNNDNLKKAFDILKTRFLDLTLDTKIRTGEDFYDFLKNKVYCVVVVSISEISPNLVLDALSLGVPVVVTEDCGIKEKLSDCVVWVDSGSPESIASGIEKILDSKEYSEYMRRISKLSLSHSGKDIASEFINVYENLK
jgi:glycosyltransferase involved in cell wall biosynthesis